MKETIQTEALNRYIDIEVAAIEQFIKEYVEPLGDIGNPEKLIAKKYEQWTPQDFQTLGQIYGQPPNPLEKLIAKKEIEKLKILEAEVK